MKALISKRPESVKGKYIKKGVIKSTMGAPYKIDFNEYA